MTNHLFALERYDRSGSESPPEPVSLPATADARLVGVVHLPADDVVLALVEGPDSETVTAAASAAGWRPDRVSPAAWVCSPVSPPVYPSANLGGNP